MPQNTAAIWNVNSLSKIGGFSPECNGTGETITVDKFGKVPLAGMEDFHALLSIKKIEQKVRWGMIGKNDPLKWNVDFAPGSDRELNHLKKIARQHKVMETYAEKIFSGQAFNDTMDDLFSAYHVK